MRVTKCSRTVTETDTETEAHSDVDDENVSQEARNTTNKPEDTHSHTNSARRQSECKGISLGSREFNNPERNDRTTELFEHWGKF